MKKTILFLLLLLPFQVKADNLAPSATSSILIESTTGKVLYENNADEKLPPASMTKIMTLLLTMEALESGKLKLDEEIFISPFASSMGGSQVFLEPNTYMKAEELIKSIAIASANDSAVALAEKISGTLEAFINLMNKRAKEIGCTNTNFVNVHGLDDDNHYSSARDMSLMAMELLKHEGILKYTSIYEEYLKKPDGSSTWMVNTNKLIRYYNGLDGLKTGYTSKAGYCLTATAKKSNMRLISVIMKEPTSQIRNSETIELLNYGFSNYKLKTIIEKKQPLGKVEVLYGKKESLKIELAKDATSLESIDDEKKYTYNINVDKIKAPVKKGDIIGNLEVIENGVVTNNIDIISSETILKANIGNLFIRNLRNIFIGH